MSKGKLYIIIIAACTVGYIWLIYCISHDNSTGFDVCVFRTLTGIPCPSCGSTRSVSALLHGNMADAFRFNPFGFVIAAIMTVSPVWITIDLILGKAGFFETYLKAEKFIKKKPVALILIASVIANWIRNIVMHFGGV